MSCLASIPSGVSSEPLSLWCHTQQEHIFTHCPFFSTLKFNQVMGCDSGATISPDPLIAIPPSQGIEKGGQIFLNWIITFVIPAVRRRRINIKSNEYLSSTDKKKKWKTKSRCSGAISHLKNPEFLRSQQSVRGNEWVMFSRTSAAIFAQCPWASHLTCCCSSEATTKWKDVDDGDFSELKRRCGKFL